MASEPDEIDWTDVTEVMARQILDQGELYLQNQVTLAIAADQRATTAASIFSSMAAAVAAAVVALWGKPGSEAMIVSGLLGLALIILAAGFAAWAARPTEFNTPGNHPEQWYVGRHANLVSMIGGEAESVQRRIVKNDDILRENQEALRSAFWLAIAAPVFAILPWLVR
jgi:hypothetical protein